MFGMGNSKTPKILFTILNMGLGHVSRSLPLINDLRSRGIQLYIGSSGRSLLFLQDEVQNTGFIELPDYELTYSQKGVSLPILFSQIPSLLGKIHQEHNVIESVIERENINLVLSDHRYGCYSHQVPSIFISHQLRFITPPYLRLFEFVGTGFNKWFHQKYDKVVVPDILKGSEGIISGKLSRQDHDKKYFFTGIMSSLYKMENCQQDIDILISVSGPEPQRTIFEQIVRSQMEMMEGNIIVLLGKPESGVIEEPRGHLKIIHHASRKLMNDLLNRAKLVVTRPGYSTIMEIAELGKKALFIPTLGQTEQLYLAERLVKNGWFYSVSQNKLNLSKDIRIANKYPGFPQKFSTRQSLSMIWELIEPYLVNA